MWPEPEPLEPPSSPRSIKLPFEILPLMSSFRSFRPGSVLPVRGRLAAMFVATMMLLPGAIGATPPPQPDPWTGWMGGMPGAIQPFELSGPEGAVVQIETAEGWSSPKTLPLRMGLVVGRPYRLRVMNLPGRDGEELFPTVRLLARLDVPPGTAWRFPVEVVLDREDLDDAFRGAMIRRIVYSSLECHESHARGEDSFDVKPGVDPLAVARELGDPVAEVVIGNRLPPSVSR